LHRCRGAEAGKGRAVGRGIDALAAQVGGIGMSPGANIGDGTAVFEATHGTAPKYAGQDKVNPGSVILSGVLMFEYMGWQPVADRISEAIGKTIEQKTVTYDFARQMKGAKEVKCSEFMDSCFKEGIRGEGGRISLKFPKEPLQLSNSRTKDRARGDVIARLGAF